ncbi:phosphotransferase enzyme family protein [Actinomadura sp. 3N407]|uniref:phosphotransferase enzyme family protein n=1 Tax=Actinomadura sp. 3N407 TaxID=3457423 RepID=UPI003FCCEF37
MSEQGNAHHPDRLRAIAEAALPHYGWDPATAEVTLLNLSENATYLLRDGELEAVLRVHRPDYHDLEAIRSELAWTASLRQEAQVAAPVALPTTGGRLVADVAHPDGIERRHCVLFERLPGEAPSEDEELVPWFERLGQITAGLHRHARGWRPPPWFRRFSWDCDDAFGELPRWGHWRDGPGVGLAETALLERVERLVRARLDRFGRTPDRFGLVHADMRLANLLHHESTTHVIDFDDCGYSWHLYDLATALTFIEDHPRAGQMIDAWLRGYGTVRALSSAELAEIPTLIMLRRLLMIAWLGSHGEVPEAKTLAATYTPAACAMAEQYLAKPDVLH